MAALHSRPKFFEPAGHTNLNFNIFAHEYERASYALGLLEGSQRNLHNPGLLISPLTVKEATASSKIEGTLSGVSDVFVYEASEQYGDADARQVSNYRQAMTFALGELKRGRKISSHFVESLHAILLHKVRHKGPLGRFRDNTVYIAGGFADPIENAMYVPPEFFMIRDYMENMFGYVEKSPDSALIKAGLFHYQFEAVHPFFDGNGRIGRLMIPLILHQLGTISSPVMYISGFLESHRTEYLRALSDVDINERYEKWLSFFFRCVAEQAKVTQDLIEKIFNLNSAVKDKFKKTKSNFVFLFIEFLFEFPVFTLQDMQKNLGIKTYVTAAALIKSFLEKGIIKGTGLKKGRARLYSFDPLLDLLN